LRNLRRADRGSDRRRTVSDVELSLRELTVAFSVHQPKYNNKLTLVWAGPDGERLTRQVHLVCGFFLTSSRSAAPP
jgi:hypothetical protein